MAKAIKCDRCGAYYDKNERFVVLRNGSTRVDGIATTTLNGFYHKSYELCDDCLEKLREFLGVENYR